MNAEDTTKVAAQGSSFEPLVGVVTTDLAGITRGRFVAARHLDRIAETGVGWVPANISLTPFDTIADANPWGSQGDLRILPDMAARFRTVRTGSLTPFDLICGNIVELDGRPWSCCTRTLLRQALHDFKALTGVSIIASFEQEFQLFDAAFPPAPAFSFAALRRADPFAAQLVAALQEASIDPEVIIAEFGQNQFEVTCAPTAALGAADRCIAIREITREVARNAGWRASFAPKTRPDAIGNGVHIHFSFLNERNEPAMYDKSGPAGMSRLCGSFCAGVLRHLPAITALTAPSVASYYRLRPHNWSASYTWLGRQDREASLRICPLVTIGGRDAATQYNIEFRAADATANPYLALASIVRAGIEGVRAHLAAPPLVSGDPSAMSDTERRALGLVRLPETLSDSLSCLAGDPVVNSWFDPLLIESFRGMKRAEVAALASLDPAAVCERYGTLY